MKNTIDSNFAITILALVAACVGFAFLLYTGLSQNEYDDDNLVINPPSGTVDTSDGECVVSGCSGHICAEEVMMSTCEWTESYACYKNAQCTRQESGVCGWSDTPELKSCLQESGNPEPPLAEGMRELRGIVTRIDRDSQKSLLLTEAGAISESVTEQVDGGWHITLDSGDRIQTGSGEALPEDSFSFDISHVQPGDNIRVQTRMNQYGILDLNCSECSLIIE